MRGKSMQRHAPPARWLAIVALTLAAAACSPNDDPIATSTPPTTEAPSSSTSTSPTPTLTDSPSTSTSPGSASTSSAPASVSPTPDPAAQKEAVTAAYLAYWDVLVYDHKVPDPKDPRVAEATTGKARTHLEGVLTLRQAYKQKTYGVPVHRIGPVTVKGKSATLIDCMDTSKSGVVDENGKKLTVGVPRFPLTVTLELGPDERWRVALTTNREGAKC